MFSKNTVLVTGASKGIGRAIATEIAKVGYSVVIHYGRDVVGAEETLQIIQNNGGAGRLLPFDISDRDSCRECLEADIQVYGAYYGVVLNAGITKDNVFPALEDEEWDQVLNTNLGGFYNVLKPLVMPMVRRRKAGRIITLSSVSGLMGNRGQVNYSASKAGIIGGTKALAIELAKHNITVNAVAPGVIETQMIEGIPLEEIKRLVPMKRVGKPEEVASAIVFLLSEGAGYITRQVISINGGMF